MKRKVFTTALAVCLVALIACGSLAYFTATKTVTNTFMTTNYDPENPPESGDDIFSVELFETKVDGDGQETTTDGNTYKDILPGASFKKDPTVKNTGLYGMWVRISVTFDNVANWNAAGYSYDKLFKTLIGDVDTEKWDAVAPTAPASDNTTYVFYYKDVLGTSEDNNTATLFDKVTIPTSLTTDQMVSLAKFNITVKADAIQSDYNGDTAQNGFKNWSEPTK